jgi:hypothetical protein
VDVGGKDAVAALEVLAELLAEAEWLAVEPRGGEALGEPLPLPLPPALAVGGAGLLEAALLREAPPAPAPAGEAVPAPEADGLAEAAPEALPVPLLLRDRVGEGVGEGVREPVPEALAPSVSVEVGVPEVEGVAGALVEAVALGVPLAEGVGEGAGVPLPLPVGEGVAGALVEAVALGAPLPLPVGLGAGVGVPVGEAPTVAVAEGVGVGVAEGSAQVIARSRRFPASENTTRERAKSNATPTGPLIAASAAGPLSPPKLGALVPASVLTTPATVSTRRKRWPANSATTRNRPEEAAAKATGSLKVAPVPTPLAAPAVPLPARVRTAPEVVLTTRTLLQKRSAAYRSCPPTLRAREKAWWKVAAVPIAESTQLLVPLPASVPTVALTAPTLLTTRTKSAPDAGAREVDT